MNESSPMSTTNELAPSVAASAAALSNKVAIGGGGVSVLGYFASNEVLGALGAAAAVLGFGVNLYFGWRDDRRKQQAHEAAEEERRERLRLMREDRE